LFVLAFLVNGQMTEAYALIEQGLRE